MMCFHNIQHEEYEIFLVAFPEVGFLPKNRKSLGIANVMDMSEKVAVLWSAQE